MTTTTAEVEDVNLADEVEADIQQIVTHFETKRVVADQRFEPVMIGYHRDGYRIAALMGPDKEYDLEADQALMLFALRAIGCQSVLYGFDAKIGVAFVSENHSENVNSSALLVVYAAPDQSFIRGFEYADGMFKDKENPVCAEPANSNSFRASAVQVLGMEQNPPDGYIFLEVMRDRGFTLGITHAETWNNLSIDMQDTLTYVPL